MVWTGMEQLSVKLLRFLVALVMARLLTPSDYGMVGMLSIFLAIAWTFLDSGIGSALIQKKDRTDEDYSTAFYFNFAVGVSFYALLFAAAPWIAAFYGVPELTSITRVISLGLVTSSLCTVQLTRLTVNLRFGAQSAIAVSALAVSSVLGIFLAYRGYGAWALVWQILLSDAINVCLLWIVSGWRPKLVFSVQSFRRLFGFGSKLLCSTLIDTVYGNLYTLVIGKMFGSASLGFYSRANGFAVLPSDTVTSVVLKVNYPILSRFQDDSQMLVSACRRLVRLPMFVLAPMLFGLAVMAEPLVKVLIGDKWLPCVPLLQVLCLGVLWNPLAQLNLNLLCVKGRADLVLKLELVKKLIAFAFLVATVPFGVFWMCVGLAAYDFIALCINCRYAKKMLGFGFFAQMREVIPVILNAAAMAGLAALAMRLSAVPLVQLALAVGMGACAYILGALAYGEESLPYVVQTLRGLLKRGRGKDSPGVRPR